MPVVAGCAFRKGFGPVSLCGAAPASSCRAVSCGDMRCCPVTCGGVQGCVGERRAGRKAGRQAMCRNAALRRSVRRDGMRCRHWARGARCRRERMSRGGRTGCGASAGVAGRGFCDSGESRGPQPPPAEARSSACAAACSAGCGRLSLLRSALRPVGSCRCGRAVSGAVRGCSGGLRPGALRRLRSETGGRFGTAHRCGDRRGRFRCRMAGGPEGGGAIGTGVFSQGKAPGFLFFSKISYIYSRDAVAHRPYIRPTTENKP